MHFLYRDKIYPVSAGFWSAVLYRLEFGESVYDIPGGENFVKKLVNLLCVSIRGDKPPASEVYAAAMQEGSFILPFCIKIYDKMMKSDKLYKKYQKSGVSSSGSEEFDELTLLAQFSKTTIPDRILEEASLPQVIGLICEFFREHIDHTEYRKMSAGEITAMYGGRKAAT